MPLSIDELRKKMQYRIEKNKEEFSRISLHLLERPLSSDTVLHIGPHRYEVTEKSFLVVIDEAPGAFWTHPVRYELYTEAKGEVRVIHEEYPLESPDVAAEMVLLHKPDLPWLEKKEDEVFFNRASLNIAELEKKFSKLSFGVPLAQSATRHALFFAGMDNMPHFHTDFVIVRNILIDRYGYDPANIVVVMGDGTGYADLPVDYAGDQAGLDAALDAFAAGGSHELGAGDTLFIYTFNHGGSDATGAYLCLSGWGSYYVGQFMAKLNNIHCGQLIVAMNQCHSGGFVNDVIATTGPAQVAIMTACREDQSAYPAGGSGYHGYLSVALAAALNWAFPTGVAMDVPGYSAGAITAQDTNNDGLVSAEEAWHYVRDMMNTYHYQTINGIETPQWGVSAPGIGADLYWGLPDVIVEDGAPWWESPDVLLLDPALIPDDTTTATGYPGNWGDYYHPDTINRVVARVHNAGCAPARNLTVEFRAMSFGAGGGTTLIGTAPITDIDPGSHEYVHSDWFFSSALVHRCIKVRADCAGDPAEPYGSAINLDDNQAQRNLDPLFAGFGETGQEKQVIERTFLVRNTDLEKATFDIVPGRNLAESRYIRAVLPDKEKLRGISIAPMEEREFKVRFEITPKADPGERLHFPIEIRKSGTKQAFGGVTFTVEVADGRLEGRLVNRMGIIPRDGTVTIENTKQDNLRYQAAVNRKGTFSFVHIVPGPYRVTAKCGNMAGQGSVFVEPNRVTKKVLPIEIHKIILREPIKKEKVKKSGKPVLTHNSQ